MPLYEYRCAACGKQFELIQKFSDPAPDECPKCGKGPAHRLMSSPAIQFKGTGWYITDYAQKGKPSADSAAEGQGESTDKSDSSKSDGKKTDAGSTSKSDSSSSSTPTTPTSSKD